MSLLPPNSDWVLEGKLRWYCACPVYESCPRCRTDRLTCWPVDLRYHSVTTTLTPPQWTMTYSSWKKMQCSESPVWLQLPPGHPPDPWRPLAWSPDNSAQTMAPAAQHAAHSPGYNNQYVLLNEWMNKWMNKWINEWMSCDWTVRLYWALSKLGQWDGSSKTARSAFSWLQWPISIVEWMNEWMNEWMDEWMNE